MSVISRRHRTCSDSSKNINRNLGILSNIQKFCKKYELSFRPDTGSGDPIEIIIESLETMIIRNEFKRVGENVSETNPYLRMNIHLNDKKILCGYFTASEICDISKLDSRIVLK